MDGLKVVTFDAASGRKAEVIDLLRDLLSQAENGRLLDFSFAAAMADGGVKTGFTATEDAPRRLAAVSRLLHRLHSIMDAQAER